MKSTNIFFLVITLFFVSNCAPYNKNYTRQYNINNEKQHINTTFADKGSIIELQGTKWLYNRKSSGVFEFNTKINHNDKVVYNGQKIDNWLLVIVNGNQIGWMTDHDIVINKPEKKEPLDSVSTGKDEDLEDKTFSIFYDQGDYLSDLINSDNFLLAYKLFKKEKEYFSKKENLAKHEQQIKVLKKELLVFYCSEIENKLDLLKILNNSDCKYNWTKIIQNDKASRSIISEIENNLLFDVNNFNSSQKSNYLKLKSILDNFCDIAIKKINRCFETVNLSEQNDLFKNAPCNIDVSQIYKNHKNYILREISSLSFSEITNYITDNPTIELYDDELFKNLTDIYLEKALSDITRNMTLPKGLEQRINFNKKLNAVVKINDNIHKYLKSRVENIYKKVVLIVISSEDNAINFEVKNDVNEEWFEILNYNSLESFKGDYKKLKDNFSNIIVLSPVDIDISKEIDSKKIVSSKYKSDVVIETNPTTQISRYLT